ncbi:MAG TPA: hypothetical protein ENF15_00655 [Candidatus Acetothermia bacterium]|nr:hypothetical protein [Candidatus Acetothermia bacterium]
MTVAVAALRTELLFVRGMPRIVVGMGPRSRERLAEALGRLRARGAVVLGFCGATHARLAPGSLILASSIRHGAEEIEVSGGLIAAAGKRLPAAEIGPVYTADRIADPPEKARLSLFAMGVDMESFHLAQELRARRVPFLILRCVLDTLWEDVSHRSLRFVGRAISCARRLGRAAEVLAPMLAGGEG